MSIKEEITATSLSNKQQSAYNIMKSGENLFLTGAAGSGKTACLKLFINNFKTKLNMGITSTTGISALLFGGSTIHSFLGIGLGTSSVEGIVKKLYSRDYLRKRWKELDVLIIDEISMLPPDLFDKLEKIACRIRRNEKPFGGIQLILSGDFLQLPCVKSSKFCFESDSWSKCVTNTVYLDKIMRQKDQKFQECLNKIRIGNIDKKTKKILKSRIGIELKNKDGILPTKLFATNKYVDYINNLELDKLAEKGYEFYEYNMDINLSCSVNNKKFILEKYKKNCNACEQLQICKDSQVILLWNIDIEMGLVNGSRGVVIGFDKDDLPIVKFMNGVTEVIEYNTWEYEENDRITATITQIPLKLAYAITIHKSQGMSIDCVELDLSNSFTEGQSYVALSRVNSLDGLSIIDIDFERIRSNKKAVDFYKRLKD